MALNHDTSLVGLAVTMLDWLSLAGAATAKFALLCPKEKYVIGISS